MGGYQGERGWEVGKMDEGSQKVQTLSYKMSREDVIYSIVTIINNSMLHMKVKRILSSQHKEKLFFHIYLMYLCKIGCSLNFL